MPLYRADLRLTSPAGTPWHSDTLFGHLCWQIAFRDGDGAVQDFIARCREGDPPFVVSDGFPAGLLPRLMLPARDDGPTRTVEQYAAAKGKRKAKWVTIEQFRQMQNGLEPEGEFPSEAWIETEALHASLDRNTNRTGGDSSAGRLFQTLGKLPAGQTEAGQPNLQVYARVAGDGVELLQDLLKRLALSGFGRDKSVGYGQFKLLCFESVPDLDRLDSLHAANGIVLLSGSVPAAGDPTDGRWKLRVKDGRLGEHFALTGTIVGENPDITHENAFAKKPLLQLEPGAVFRLNGQLRRPWYGSIVEGIAPARPEVVQGCQAVAVPLNWPS